MYTDFEYIVGIERICASHNLDWSYIYKLIEQAALLCDKYSPDAVVNWLRKVVKEKGDPWDNIVEL